MNAILPVQNVASSVQSLIGDVPPSVFSLSFSAACEDFDRFVGALAIELARTLKLPEGPPIAPDELLHSNGWDPGGLLSLQWLLETLELYGHAECASDRWNVRLPETAAPARAIREAALVLNPAALPAYRVFEQAATSLPAVLAGTLSGEEALFGIGTIDLWFDYFSNANPLYEPCNQITAVAVQRAVRGRGTVMEVGGGGGSAAQAILGRLADLGSTPARYLFTEVHPAFLRRGFRSLKSSTFLNECALETCRFDIDRDPAEQGISHSGFDIVTAVNTLHLAADPVLSLKHIRSLLATGGSVVLGELVRPAGDRGVHLELPFTLLEAYRTAPLEPGIRNRPGFMTAENWINALRLAGFAHVTLLPERLHECVAAYPGFYSVAITASV